MKLKTQKDLVSELNKLQPIHCLLIHHTVQLVLHSYFTTNNQEFYIYI